MVSLESKCVWTRSLREKGLLLTCPVAHGEGRFVVDSEATLSELESAGQIALRYAAECGEPAHGAYPENPNGSVADIAGICNAAGNVLGLMPHPENNVINRGRRGHSAVSAETTATAACLELWKSGVSYAAER